MTPMSDQTLAAAFNDVLEANHEFASSFDLGDLQPRAARGLAIVTCMDSRIPPLEVLGLRPGDAKILRNAGARVTDDVVRTLAVAVHLLGVDRVLVMPHTHCKMASASESEIHELVGQASGLDTSGITFGAIEDQHATLVDDLKRIRASTLLPKDLPVAGAVYDVKSGVLGPLVTY
jgi:carbonic anhydrase